MAILILVVLGSAACATTGASDAWTCSASGLVSASYDGSDYAHIRLRGYSSGANYKVTLNDQRTQATGITGDNTPFTCTKTKSISMTAPVDGKGLFLPLMLVG